MWKVVVQHARSHLVLKEGKGSSSSGVCKVRPEQLRDLLRGSWLSSVSSVSSHKCITIRELLNYSQVGHSHTENAKCLKHDSAFYDHCTKQGFKPIANEESFVIARLTTRPRLHQDQTGDRRCGVLSEEDGLYLADDTGTVHCQVSFCSWNWLNQALLIPCWNFIPGADARVQGFVEICPHCSPVMISRGQPEPCKVSSREVLSAAEATKLLQNHHSSKGAAIQVTVRGTVVCKSPVIRIHGKPLFFVRLASDTSGINSVPLLAKGGNITFLYAALPLMSLCTVTHLTPTTILKGTRRPYHVFLCRKETTVEVVERCCLNQEHDNSIRGTVTKCIDATSGIYELDGERRLYLCYQMDEFSSCQSLRVGCVVTVHNAHCHQRFGRSQIPSIICCMQSTVTVERLSALDTGPKKKLSPALSAMVRLLLKYNLTVGHFEWLSDILRDLERRFSPTYVRRKALHTVLLRIFNTASTVSKKLLLSGRKRNIYEEFLNPSHSCLASVETQDNQLPPLQSPDMAQISTTGYGPEKNGSKSPRRLGEPTDSKSVPVFGDWQCRVTRSNDLNPPMIILGYLHLDRTTGQVQLKDQSGSVDCLITNTSTCFQANRCAGSSTQPTPHTDAKIPTSCHLPNYTASDVSGSTARRCFFTCHHLHTWCLGHLLRVEGFLIIQEALPLSWLGPCLGIAQDHRNREGEGSVNNVKKHHRYVIFSMQSAECVSCTWTTNAIKTASSLATEVHKDTTRNRTTNEESLKSNMSSVPGGGTVSSATEPMLQKDTEILDSPEINHFLLLSKSQLINNAGDSLFFVQIILLTNFTSQQMVESAELSREGQANVGTKLAAVRFDGEAVWWYNTLYSDCVYRMTGATTMINEHEFLSELSVPSDQLKTARCGKLLHVSQDVNLEQMQEDSLLGCMSEELQTARGQFREFLLVSSVAEVVADQEDTSSGLVSFHCLILSRQMSTRQGTGHQDKRQKTLPEQQGSQSDAEVQLRVADPGLRSLTMDVYVSGSLLQNTMGLLPGASVTFRRCTRLTSPAGHVYCCVSPLTSITIDHISYDITSREDLQDNTPTNTLTDVPTDTPTDKQPDLNQSTLSTHRRRYYLSQLLACPDLVPPTEMFTVHCHLQAIKSLSLKWSCQRCGHKECVCGSGTSDLGGELTATARFAVEDGTGEALVWCSEHSAIAALLGLTGPQWTQLELAVRRCKEVVYTYKKPNCSQVVEMPPASDTEGLVNLLCSHGSIQKPLTLDCHLLVWGNNPKNAAPAIGASERQYAPSVHLKCLAASEANH